MPVSPPALECAGSGRAAPSRLHVLCVDDDPVSRRVAVLALIRPGWTVEIVNDGREALERLASVPRGFDLIVIDHCMPGMDGLELLRRLRAGGYAGEVIVVTAYDSPRLRQDYVAAGVRQIVLKPVDAPALRRAVAQACAVGPAD